jgi:hypothetical protein
MVDGDGALSTCTRRACTGSWTESSSVSLRIEADSTHVDPQLQVLLPQDWLTGAEVVCDEEYMNDDDGVE